MAETPNLLVIMTDQQRADFSAADGFALDPTPVIDALGRQGVRCARAFTPTPVCLPARCSYLTGRYPSGHGVRTNHAVPARYDRDLVDVLNAAGYTTALFGKDHTFRQLAMLGQGPPPATPYHYHVYDRILRQTALADPALEARREAFEAWMRELAHGVAAEATPFPVDLQQPARVTARAVDFLRHARREPFYLFLGFDPPHNPYQVPEPYFSLFEPGAVPPPACGPEALTGQPWPWRYLRALERHHVPDLDARVARYRASYCGMLRLIDDQVARVLEALDATGRRDDTLVLFTSDHGDYAGDFGLERKGAGLPACLARIPMAWQGPGVAPRHGDCGAHVSLVDVLPTVCGWLGVEAPAGVQGRDLGPLLAGSAADDDFPSAYVEAGEPGPPWPEGAGPAFDSTDSTLGGGITFSELNPVTMTGHWQSVVTAGGRLVRDPYGGEQLEAPDADTAAALRRQLTDWQAHLQRPEATP